MTEEKFLDSNSALSPDKLKEINDVKSIIRETIVDFHNYVFPKYIKNYKSYLGFVAERMATIDSWQSNINYPMVSATVDTMFGNIFDFGYEFGIKELGLSGLCTKAFDFRGTGKKVFKEVVKEVLITGKGYVKDYFVKEEFDDVFFGEKIKQTIKMPSIIYISIFDVLYDRSKGLENSSYKIIRTFTSGEAIKKKVLPLLLEQYNGNNKDVITNKLDKWLNDYKMNFGNRFSMYDYNPVKSLTATAQWYETIKSNKNYFDLPIAAKPTDLLGGYTDNMSMKEDSKNYFLNNIHSTYELVEYTTETERYVFINGNIIYFGKKKYNLGEIREATYSSIPGTGNAMGAADKQDNLQAIQNTLWNAFIDNIKLNLGPMFKISGNLPIGKSGTIDFKAFRAIKSNGQNDIEKVQLGVSDFAPLNFMQMVETASQKESGMSNYVIGGGGAIERTQGGIDLKFNQYKSKLTPITDSIDQMMGNIARSWIMMYLKFFTVDELGKLGVNVAKIYEPDSNGINKFVTINLNGIDIRDIIDETNITFTYNSLDKVTKENTRDVITRNLMPLLQYAGGNVNMEELGKVLAGVDFNPLKLLQSKAKQNYEEKNFNQNNNQDEVINGEEVISDEQLGEENLMNQLQNII